MPIKYTEEVCKQHISELYNSGNLNGLYSKDFLNRYGKVVDTKREYQEIYAQYIYEHLKDGQIPMLSLCAVKDYCKVPREDTVKDEEEGFQRDLFYGRKAIDKKYGKPIWFELPIHSNGKGIDLVYYNEDTFEINIFELKYNNHKESLLRAVMEIQTYYQRVDWGKAIEALKVQTVSKINKYVLFNCDCDNIYEKYKNLSDDSYVKKLIDEFGVDIVIYE